MIIFKTTKNQGFTLSLEDKNHSLLRVNVQKTELVCFKHKRKKLSNDVQIKLNRQRPFLTENVKYLGIDIEESLI